jgi:ectoine hydroxylase-related dioxygenase (phytanoyl-CoA dioxygenase family)
MIVDDHEGAAEHLDTYGFCHLRGAVAPDVVAAISDEVAAHRAHRPDPGVRLEAVEQISATVGRLVRSPELAALVATLGGGSHRVLLGAAGGVTWQRKEPPSRTSPHTGTHWHIDFPADHPLSPAFSLGIYLHDSDARNGCLAVVPRSHRTPPSEPTPDPYLVTAEAGDVVCHDGLLHHASAPGRPGSPHRDTIYMYCVAGDPAGVDGLVESERRRSVLGQRSVFIAGGETAS